LFVGAGAPFVAKPALRPFHRHEPATDPLDEMAYSCNPLDITGVIRMRISVAESLVMEALWRRSPLSADDLVTEIGPDQNWAPKTVRTLISRLLKKGAIEAARDGRRYLYAPTIERAAYVQDESRGLVDRLFDGKLA
jgi:BlaI family penicillinase repressor